MVSPFSGDYITEEPNREAISEALRIIKEERASLDGPENDTNLRRNPMCLACAHLDDADALAVVKALHAAGCNLDPPRRHTVTGIAAHVAAAYGKPATLQHLVDHGADLSIRDSMRGLTPLKKAKRSLESASGRAEIAECVQILEAAGKAGREVD